jgi:hypothetical protein
MSKPSKKSAVRDTVVTAGREEEWSENEALNVDFKSKLFYMYREVILLLLISFRQDDVSQFLFRSTNNESLKRFFTKDDVLSIIEFDKVVWFLVNNQQYVSSGCNKTFLDKYSINFLKSKTFNIIQASKSISIIICRYLYTIIRTNQNQGSTSKRGGMMSLKRLQPEDAELPSSRDKYVPTIPEELQNIIDSSSKHIADNCEIIDKMLEESYLNLNNIDPTPENFTDTPPKIIEQDTNEAKIDNNIEPIRIKDTDYIDVLTSLSNKKEDLHATRKCDRFVQLAERERLHKERALEEQEKKNKIKLELAIKAKQELDDAISKAGGETYKGIKTIEGVYYPRDEVVKIGTNDDKLLPVLAMKQKSLEVGARSKLTNNMIPNKVSVVKFLVELGLISASVDIDDDEDDEQGGGGHSNYKQYGNAGPNIKTKKGKQKYKIKDSDKVADPRGIIEGIGAQSQCGAAIGSLTHIPRVKCYICGELGGIPNMKTMECEHIFCVGLAAQYFGLLRATSFSEQQKRVLSILYAWSHRCCNQLKSNLSFMKFKSKPDENQFEFHEPNAKELLRNIYDNTVKYDCKWVDTLIKKSYTNKQVFVEKRIKVLGRYCNTLIAEINNVRTQMFHFSPQLFSFMSILKVAATTLVLLTGENKEPTLKLKSKETLPLCRLLLMKDLETISARGRRGGGHKNNKIQYGGEFDYGDDIITIEEAYNVNWAQLMKFMIQSKYSTLEVKRPSAVSEKGRGINPLFTFTISEDNVTKYDLTVMDIMLNTNINDLLNIVNTELFNHPRGNITELQPGTFFIIAPNNSKVELSKFNTLLDAMEALKMSSESRAQIQYIPPNNGPGTVEVDHASLNNPIFRLLALNHQINPYSLIAALLYNNENEAYSSEMLESIVTISGDFNPESYTRCEASVILLKTLLGHPYSEIPAKILDHMRPQTHILDRIKKKLLVVELAELTAEQTQAINAILLIVYPYELPTDNSKDDEIIDDILTFIYHDNKNTLYFTLIIDTFKIGDLLVFKRPTPKEIAHDGKFDEHDGGDDSGDDSGDDGMAAYGDSIASRPNDSTIVSRIRNLLIVIAGVYFAYGYQSLDSFVTTLEDLCITTNLITQEELNKRLSGRDMSHIGDATTNRFKIFFDILITHLKQHTISSNYEDLKNLWYQLVVNFFNDKLVLYTNEQPLSPIIRSQGVGSGPYDMLDSSTRSDSPPLTPPLTPTSSDYNPSISSLSPESSQILSQSGNPPPQQDIDADLIVELLNGIDSSIREKESIFDTINFKEYLGLFTRKVNRDSTYVSLRFQLPPDRDIQEPINAIQTFVDSSFHGGKANKKKSTKRRTPRHRQHKRSQYSKKKRNTLSKRKKRVSIKHKRSRTKYHDTRKRRK